MSRLRLILTLTCARGVRLLRHGHWLQSKYLSILRNVAFDGTADDHLVMSVAFCLALHGRGVLPRINPVNDCGWLRQSGHIMSNSKQ